jgi:AcrR family transcriptional regulator
MDLFLSRGYEKTTLEQVCEIAETSLRTLLRYFPTKEALALGRELISLEDFKESLASLDPSTPLIVFWRERVSSHSRDIDEAKYLARVKLFDSAQAIEAQMLALQVTYENLLAGAFAREAGVDPEWDLHSRLLAATLVAGNRAATRRWVASEGRLNLARLRTDVIDWVADNFPARANATASPVAGPRRRAV